jgi:hypothetical protein
MWRPVIHGLATYAEVDGQWTIPILLEAHELMDIQLERDQYYRKHPAPGGG